MFYTEANRCRTGSIHSRMRIHPGAQIKHAPSATQDLRVGNRCPLGCPIGCPVRGTPEGVPDVDNPVNAPTASEPGVGPAGSGDDIRGHRRIAFDFSDEERGIAVSNGHADRDVPGEIM